MSKEYWTKKNGKKIDVDEMSIEHLKNTLKMLIRNNRRKHTDSLMAQESCEDHMDDACDATEIDIY